MPLRLPRFALLLAALLIFTGIPSFAEFYTDWLWFKELGYEQVFLKSLSAQATTGLAVGAVVFVILWLNLRLSLRQLKRREFAIATPEGPRVITVETGRLRSIVYAAALIAAVLMGLFSASSWATWLYAIHATPFGKTDPVLGRDIAFYLFRLPLLELLHGIALTTVILTIVGVAGSHVAAGNLALDPLRGVIASPGAKRHLSLLVGGPAGHPGVWRVAAGFRISSPSNRASSSARRMSTSTRACPPIGCWRRRRSPARRWPSTRPSLSACCPSSGPSRSMSSSPLAAASMPASSSASSSARTSRCARRRTS